MLMRTPLFALAVAFSIWWGAAAQAEHAVDAFNEGMQAAASGSGSQRLEAAAGALRSSLDATAVVTSIIGEHQQRFNDQQLARLARALLYKLACDVLSVSDGGTLRMEADGRGSTRRGLTTIPVRVWADRGSRPVEASIVLGDDRIVDVVINGQSMVQSERDELTQTLRAVGGDPEATISVIEQTVQSFLATM